MACIDLGIWIGLRGYWSMAGGRFPCPDGFSSGWIRRVPTASQGPFCAFCAPPWGSSALQSDLGATFLAASTARWPAACSSSSAACRCSGALRPAACSSVKSSSIAFMAMALPGMNVLLVGGGAARLGMAIPPTAWTGLPFSISYVRSSKCARILSYFCYVCYVRYINPLLGRLWAVFE